MAELFRKSALDKLSSPDQVDRAVVLVPKSNWIAVLGCAVMVVVAAIWSVTGRISQTVSVSGILVTGDGIHSVMAPTTGTVEEVVLHNGDYVKKGDVLAVMDSTDIDRKISLCEEKIEKVDAMTMDSTGDVVTADNKSLMDIKNQVYTLDQNLRQNQAMLAMKSQELAKQQHIENEAQKKMLEAEREYYASLAVGDNTKEQLSFNQAQDKLSTTSNYLENYSDNLAQARVRYNQALDAYDDIKDEYEDFKKKKKSMLSVAEAAKDDYDYSVSDVLNSIRDVLNRTETSVEERKEEVIRNGDDPESDNEYQSLRDEANRIANVLNDAQDIRDISEWSTFDAKGYADLRNVISSAEKYASVQREYQEYTAAWDEKVTQYESTIDQYKRERDAAKSTLDEYQSKVNSFSDQKNNAVSELDDARQDYLDKIDSVILNQNNQSIHSNEYNVASNKYNAERSILNSIKDSVDQLEVQVSSDRENRDVQLENLHAQFDATKSSILNQLNMELNDYKKQLDDLTIKSTVSGQISDINLVNGSMINQGSVIARVRQGDDPDNIIVCYAPVSSGKKIDAGMRALIYPSTVNKQEYGHMEGRVEEVSDYVTSSSDIQIMLGSDELVQAFSQNGPVIAVRCRIEEDASTMSGYRWSSVKGKDIMLSSGTMMSVDVVTSEKPPISLLLPYLKEKLRIVPVQEGNKQ